MSKGLAKFNEFTFWLSTALVFVNAGMAMLCMHVQVLGPQAPTFLWSGALCAVGAVLSYNSLPE